MHIQQLFFRSALMLGTYLFCGLCRTSCPTLQSGLISSFLELKGIMNSQSYVFHTVCLRDCAHQRGEKKTFLDMVLHSKACAHSYKGLSHPSLNSKKTFMQKKRDISEMCHDSSILFHIVW